MSNLKKSFNIIDIIKYSFPSVLDIDIRLTSERLRIPQEERYFAYSSIWPRVNHIIDNGASEEYLIRNFSFYKDAWKNRYLRDVARELDRYFSGRGKWYRTVANRRPVLGVSFWPAQHGVWFQGGRAYNVLVHPSRSIQITPSDARFVARAIYELHGRDDPNNPDQLILDVSQMADKGGRVLKAHHLSELNAISLREFEDIMMRFFQALALAGVAESPASGKAVREILQKKDLSSR